MLDENYKNQLLEVFKTLNDFIEGQNQILRAEGMSIISKQVVKIAGQTVLILADLPFPVTATMDLDVVSTLPHAVSKKLAELLVEKGLRLETDGHLIWMPEATQYTIIADLAHVQVLVADIECVLASKIKFKRPKDAALIKNYFEYFPQSKERLEKLSEK